ncbi:hypothetical protein JIN84_08680 [Luteolibacter yonseiensis]|uniref:Uncharacterized protein n=1 Tax=Luteolibacter yonseiensis TaxID=1144680 RepID=A0A934R5T3_9BACT|nr:hypothetical protein [Luteolibacter yonseiensis]MBK1815689.1 hypothetical protein [Luteolibacter yonseiensis]
MKTSIMIARAAGLAVILGMGRTASGEEPAGKPVMRDAATHEELSSALRKIQQQDPMKAFEAVKGEDPSVAHQPGDLVSRSEILCFNGIATLVPKGAIVQTPKNLSDRLVMKPGAKIKTWADFYALNRGWINTVEVSLVQAEGKEPIAEQTREHIVKSGNLTVATYRGNPISVLPPKVAPPAPATPAEESKEKPTKP